MRPEGLKPITGHILEYLKSHRWDAVRFGAAVASDISLTLLDVNSPESHYFLAGTLYYSLSRFLNFSRGKSLTWSLGMSGFIGDWIQIQRPSPSMLYLRPLGL